MFGKKIIVVLLIFLIMVTISGCLKAPDSDGDGTRDPVDAFPDDPTDWKDSDGDGLGDNAEERLGTNPFNPDSDGDGHMDSMDLEPLNPEIGADRDGDGHHDAIDAFPDDPAEWIDTDGDGYGDNSDRYPNDALYHASVSKMLQNFTYEMSNAITIFENGSQGGEYTIQVMNNEALGGNFTVTVNTCNRVERTVETCAPGTEKSGSAVIYLGPGETGTVVIKVLNDYITQRYTFKRWIVITPPVGEEPI